jgi:hypothetical protein
MALLQCAGIAVELQHELSVMAELSEKQDVQLPAEGPQLNDRIAVERVS